MLSHFLRKLTQRQLLGVVTTVELDSIVWHLSEAGQRQISVGELPLPTGAVVKENLQRTISRVQLAQADVFVKVCRVNTIRNWLRELIRPPKAQLEFENAIELQHLGIVTPTPLAWSRPSGWLPQPTMLVTLAVQSAISLEAALEGTPSPARRRKLAQVLAEFFARCHDAGITHPDPHPGNFLWQNDAELVMLDVHAVHFGSPLSQTATIENLVLWNRWFQQRATRSDRARFWNSYVRSRKQWSGAVPAQRELSRQIEQQTSTSNCRFWAARLGRYVVKNRASRPLQHGRLKGYVMNDLSGPVIDELLHDPDRPFRGLSTAEVLKNSRTSSVARINDPNSGRAYLWKRFNLKSPLLPLKNLLRPSPALRSWLAGNSVRDRGLATPRPLLMVQRYPFGVPTTGYILFEWLDNAQELGSALRACPGTSEANLLIEQVARLLRRMHDRQVSHRDLKAANILVQHGEPILIDLVGVELNRPVSDALRQRDLARLAASFLQVPGVNRSAFWRFLQTYLQLVPSHAGDPKVWWQAVRRLVEQKIQRNSRVGRPLN